MKQAIAVFRGKYWIEYKPLFDMLHFFNVKIIGQDSYGDNVHEVKDDYLLIEDGTARWGSLDDFKKFVGTESGIVLGVSTLHYDANIYNLKQFYKKEG